MGATIHDAKYTPSPVDLYMGNPFIETLPDMLTPEEAYKALSYIPPVPTPDQMSRPKHIRIHELSLLRLLILPLNDYLEFEPKFSVMLRAGYVSRALTPDNWKLTYALAMRRRNKLFVRPRVDNSAFGLMLYGLSGLGKSTLLNSLLSLYPQAVIHKDLDGPGSRWTQIVWIRVNVPPGGSLIGLCKRILREIARILGDPDIARVVQNPSIQDLLDRISSLARNYFIGLIAIDDLQHLREANSAHKTKALQFLTDLIEVAGVPVLCIGTYAVEPLFQDAFKAARKVGGLGLHEMYRPVGPNDAQWNDLVEFTWPYQWLGTRRRLTPGLRQELYVQSMAIPDVLIKLYLLAQLYAIRYSKDAKSERISVALIREIANRDLRILQPALNILRRSYLKRLTVNDLLRFDELFPKGDWFDDVLVGAMRQEIGTREVKDTTTRQKDEPVSSGRPDETYPKTPFDLRIHIKDPKKAYVDLKTAGLVIRDHMDID